MGKGRLEAFSDGVIAIIITIMVLEMKVPHGESFESLLPLIPVFLSRQALGGGEESRRPALPPALAHGPEQGLGRHGHLSLR